MGVIKMAEKFGSLGESYSQKRTWVDCQSPGEKSDIPGDCSTLEPPLLFSKRSRSEQEFVKKEGLQRCSSDVTERGCEMNTSQCLGTHCNQSDSSQLSKNDHHSASFTIGPSEGEGEARTRNGHDADSSELNSSVNSVQSVEDVEDPDEFTENSSESAGWQPLAGPLSWVQQQMSLGVDPRELLRHILPRHASVPADLDQLMLWKLIINILSEPPPRKKLKHINTLDQVVSLIKDCKNIMVLTGAGVSVSCGIPDFRSQNGIYARLSVEYPDLPDPQAMFDIHYFHNNQKPFFKFAKEIYPGQFEPSRSHKFIKLIEDHNKLLRNYTQNIDTLEQVAGIKNVIQCHGSFATATCMVCKYKTDADAIRDNIMNQVIPRCPKCPSEEPLAILKPDIVFFGESLPNEFHHQMDQDKDICDLLIVIGSSLKVRPVALIPNSIPDHVPQVLINREPLKQLNFDVELLGDCDIIIQELCKRLGPSWHSVCTSTELAVEINYDEMLTPSNQSPVYHPTPPNSEESTRMSFQLSSDDNNSRMSLMQDAEGTSQAQRGAGMGFNLNKEDSSMSFDDSDTRQSSDIPENAEMYDKYAKPDAHQHEDISEHAATETGEQVSADEHRHTLNKHDEMLMDSSHVSSHRNNPRMISAEVSSSLTNSCSQRQLEELRACWQPRLVNLASRLREDTYLFVPPNRYVFKGAEVYDSLDSDTSSDRDSSSGSSSSLDTLDQDIDGTALKSDVMASNEQDGDRHNLKVDSSTSSYAKNDTASP